MRFTQKFKMAAKNGKKTIFEKSPVNSADTQGVKNFIEITPSHTFFKILVFLCFAQNLKMGHQKWQENKF